MYYISFTLLYQCKDTRLQGFYPLHTGKHTQAQRELQTRSHMKVVAALFRHLIIPKAQDYTARAQSTVLHPILCDPILQYANFATDTNLHLRKARYSKMVI